MLKRLLPLLLILSLYTVSTAQEETPTPTPTPTPDVPGYILGWDSALLYPSALRFDLTIGRSADQIRSLILTLDIDGRETEIIDVNVDEWVVRSGDFVELAYLYEIDSPPPFLSVVEYTWLVAVDDEEAVDVPGALRYTDSRFDWSMIEGDGVTLILPEDTPDAEDVLEDVLLVYDLLAESTGQRETFSFILFPDEVDQNPCSLNEDEERTITDPRTETEFVCDDDLVADTFAAIDTIPLNVAFTDAGVATRPLMERMVPEFYDALWNNDDVPAWFREGLRTFYLPIPNFSDFDVLQSAARSNRLLSLAQLSQGEAVLRTAQANGMVIYMADRTGVEALFDFANAAGETDSFSTLYEEQFGTSLETLVPAMSTWLFTRAAEAAFAYVPYLPTTPTPTATESLTPFPPTPTDTVTATATITPTASVTGFLSATPLPSLTPTLTQTPRPPTVTPRPAGSVIDPTATPLPVQRETENDDPDIQRIGLFVVGAGGLLFIVAILVAFIRGRTTRST